MANKEGKIGRALAGGHLPSLAKSIVSHNELRELVFLHFLDEINAECSKLCQLKPQPSLFRKIPSSMYDNFTWNVLVEDLKGRAPTFFQVLSMAAAVILKERNREMNGIQSLVSLTMFATHTLISRYTMTFIVHILYYMRNTFHVGVYSAESPKGVYQL